MHDIRKCQEDHLGFEREKTGDLQETPAVSDEKIDLMMEENTLRLDQGVDLQASLMKNPARNQGEKRRSQEDGW